MAFLVALDQNKGLMGKNGLLPIPSYLSILRDHFMVRLQCCVNRHIVARYNIGEQYTPTLLMYAMHTVVYECKNSGLMVKNVHILDFRFQQTAVLPSQLCQQCQHCYGGYERKIQM